MRAVIQRVRRSSVDVEGREVSAIGPGLLVLLAVRRGDGGDEVRYMAEKILDLRIFPDEKHPINRSIRDVGGEILLVSQFTLYGDCRRGRRPSFDDAEVPERAQGTYQEFAEYLRGQGFPPKEGLFGAHMIVRIENEGPVTVLLDSEKRF